MAVSMTTPKCSRLVWATVLLAGLVLLAGTQQMCQAGVLSSARTSPCSWLSAVQAPAATQPTESSLPAGRLTAGEDPATAAFAICLVIKDQAEDLREVCDLRRIWPARDGPPLADHRMTGCSDCKTSQPEQRQSVVRRGSKSYGAARVRDKVGLAASCCHRANAHNGAHHKTAAACA